MILFPAPTLPMPSIQWGDRVEVCAPATLEPPGWKVPEGTEVLGTTVTFAPDQPPAVSWFPVRGEEGWSYYEARPWKPPPPTADRKDGAIRIWTNPHSCEWTARGCGDDPWYIPPEIFVTFPAPAGACFAGQIGLPGKGLVEVLGEELVALADGAVIGRYALPGRVTQIVHDEEGVLVATADGAWSMLRWTAAEPVFARLALRGQGWTVDGSVVVMDDALVGLDDSLAVRWRLEGRPLSILRAEEGMWVLTGTTTSRVVLVDPVSGAILRDWTVAPGPPHIAQLTDLDRPPEAPGPTAGLDLYWLQPAPEAEPRRGRRKDAR